ncbi:polysaccharide biosynthesis tyrosine autokinase [Crocinitomix sp.]|nr:polysaccharide biosynthesis tyrosine autokinase [Crocinitomix sp.]
MNIDLENTTNENTGFDINEILSLLKKNWKLILFTLIFTLSFAFVYIRYATERYSSSAKIFVKDGSRDFSPFDLELSGVQLLNGDNGAESEAEILKSRMLLAIVIKKLELYVEIHRYGGRAGSKKVELYDGSPFTVESVLGDSILYDTKLAFKVNIIDQSHYQIVSENGEKQFVKSGVPFTLEGKTLKLSSTKNYHDSWRNNDFVVSISPIDEVITKIGKSLTINTEKGDIGIVKVIFEGGNIRKNNAIVNELIYEHQAAAIREKNRIAQNTNDFLTNRIALIEEKLRGIEEKGRTLKTEQGIVSVDAEITSILIQEKELESELQSTSVNLELANQMASYVQDNGDNKNLIPVNLGFENQSLTQNVQAYNDLIIKRNNLFVGSSTENPLVKKIESDLAILNSNLEISLNSLIKSLESQIKKLDAKLNVYKGEISNIPGYEMRYRDVMRDQQISESIYLLLLQKKEENEIILVSNQGNIRVIDYAYSNGLPVFPNKKTTYLLAFLMGLIIPALFIFIRFLLDYKFKGTADLERLGLPSIGEIPQSKDKKGILSDSDPRSQSTEAFRLLRSNIYFMLDTQEQANTIMVTSTVSGEGKTYVSLKLAQSLAKTMKKVAVVGMDLRAPKLMEYIDIPYSIGVSNYLMKNEISLEDIMIQHPTNELITFIPSGTIPPNPNEILMRPRVDELFKSLREKFDYIIVDTSPIGLVADTLSILKHSNLTLYVARANYIDKRKLVIPQKLYQQKKFKNAIWLVNGIDMKDNVYGYGYGYGSNTQNDIKTKLKDRIKKLFGI